jgi:hypothetical protein
MPPFVSILYREEEEGHFAHNPLLSFLTAPEAPPPICFRFLPKNPCLFSSVTCSPLLSLSSFSPVAPGVLSSLQIGP